MAIMKVWGFWNYFNHHQVSVADKMYRLMSCNFYSIATLPRDLNELKGSMDYSSHPYCI